MLNVRRQMRVAENMYKFVNTQGSPECCSMFTLVSDYHTRSTRSTTNSLLKPPSWRIKATERGIRYFGVLVWNQIPLDVRNRESIQVFKSQLHAEMFGNPHNVVKILVITRYHSFSTYGKYDYWIHLMQT